MREHRREPFRLGFQQPQRCFRIVIGAAHVEEGQFLAPHDMEREIHMILRGNTGYDYAPGVACRMHALVDGVAGGSAVDRDVDAALRTIV